MLRSDGTFIIYIVQHRFIGSAKKDTVDYREPVYKWMDSNFDHFFLWDDTARRKHKDLRDAFSASGECWQQTGVKGSFSVLDISCILPVLEQQWPLYRFRGKEVTISQRTKILCTECGSEKACEHWLLAQTGTEIDALKGHKESLPPHMYIL